MSAPPPPYHDEHHVGYAPHGSAMHIGRLSDEDLFYNEQIHLREEMALLKFKDEKEKEQKKEEKEFKKVAQQLREKLPRLGQTVGQASVHGLIPDFTDEINIKKLQEITDDTIVTVIGTLLIMRNGVFVLDYTTPRFGLPPTPEYLGRLINEICGQRTPILHTTPIIRPLYTFNKPLSVSYIGMLLSSDIFQSINSDGGYMWSATPSSTLKRFETVMRIVPGSYKNGGWKQLDGFYGVYYNEAKMELSGIPPPIEEDE
jgi:hypothetical protein